MQGELGGVGEHAGGLGALEQVAGVEEAVEVALLVPTPQPSQAQRCGEHAWLMARVLLRAFCVSHQQALPTMSLTGVAKS